MSINYSDMSTQNRMLAHSTHCAFHGDRQTHIDVNNEPTIDEVLRLIERIDQINEQLVPNMDKNVDIEKQTKRVNKSLATVFERNTDSQSNKKIKKNHSDNANELMSCGSKTARIGTKFVFAVVWGKYKPYKKHKEWTGDGFVVINDSNKSIMFYDISGDSMGSSRVVKSSDDYTEGKRMVIGDKELELINEVSLQEFEHKSLFVKDQ